MTKIKKIIFIVVLSLSLLSLGGYQYLNRLKEITEDFAHLTPNKNTAIFAAYSADGTVSDYVISYLKALKEIAPNIIYITDNPLKQSAVNKLKPYVNHLEAKRHGKYDWGSYKQGFNWLNRQNISLSANLLILANDSALLVKPSLQPVFQKMENTADFWGITANIDGTYHLQSYFLVLTPKVYNSQQFAQYLNSVTHQKDGLTVAYRYEVPFTRYFESLGFKSAAFIPYKQLSHLPLNDKNCYPLTLLTQYDMPFLKMRVFTNRLTVQESRRLLFHWLKENTPHAYQDLINHLTHIHSPYLKENKS